MNNAELSDVKLVSSDGREFFAHRCILYSKCKTLYRGKEERDSATGSNEWTAKEEAKGREREVQGRERKGIEGKRREGKLRGKEGRKGTRRRENEGEGNGKEGKGRKASGRDREE